MRYKKGDVVIVKFPFIRKEISETHKGRPALVICNDAVEKRYEDVILAAITSQVPVDILELEIALEPTKITGLVKKSLLRLDFIMTIPGALINRKIGVLPENIMREVDLKLKKIFGI